jgi:hypothetical protein
MSGLTVETCAKLAVLAASRQVAQCTAVPQRCSVQAPAADSNRGPYGHACAAARDKHPQAAAKSGGLLGDPGTSNLQLVAAQAAAQLVMPNHSTGRPFSGPHHHLNCDTKKTTRCIIHVQQQSAVPQALATPAHVHSPHHTLPCAACWHADSPAALQSVRGADTSLAAVLLLAHQPTQGASQAWQDANGTPAMSVHALPACCMPQTSQLRGARE